MGREAICKCDWAGVTAEVKVLLEPNEMIVRGEIRKRVPRTELNEVKVQSDRLCFTVGRESVQLFLGSTAAVSWAKAIATPLPSLSRKLGITDKTIVRTIGNIHDDALKSALAEAARISARGADLIVACVDTPESLRATLREAKAQLSQGVPIWMVYAKGPGHSLNEASIRSLLRANGMMDTKVASVSAGLTALRFSLRKSNQDAQ
jgi:hypothetical protein